ncbi:MAG: membrane dipeptidase [Candidatus Aminicenantes bacterium]|nr:MAG: membrane dipeptidase [Candidatus Aminicenantes bacterium]
MTRRNALKMIAGTTGVVLSAPMINLGRYQLFSGTQETYSARAISLIERSLVIDMLSPLAINSAVYRKWLQNPDSFTPEEGKKYQTSGINVFHPAFGIGGPNAYETVLRFFASWNSFLPNHDQLFMRIDSIEDFNRVKESGKVGLLLGLQNSDHFRRATDVNYFHSIGQRVSQLTYNARNLIGSGSTERSDGGLSDFGVSIIERMNKAGMAVDVSHCGDRTTLDAFEVSKKPVLITHSNCRSFVPGHPRCKTDEAISKMAVTGGVMGITGVRMFVRPDEPTTIEHVIDHFDHVAKLIGVEHVGVGSDSDLEGYDDLPQSMITALRRGYKESYAFREKIDIEGLDHSKRMFDLAEALCRRGYSDADIEGILGGNFKRVLSQIWIA